MTNTLKSVAIFIVVVSSCLVFFGSTKGFISPINGDKERARKRASVQ
jgi:hypothetical protein